MYKDKNELRESIQAAEYGLIGWAEVRKLALQRCQEWLTEGQADATDEVELD